MLRAIVLSLVLFVSMAATLPLADSLAQGFKNRPSVSRNARRRHSRAWWRRYRARLAKRRAAENRARELTALRAQDPVAPESLERSTASNAVAATGGVFNGPQGLWSMKLPRGWSNRPTTQNNGEMRFKVFERSGKPIGQASFAFVTSAQGAPDASLSARARKQTLAGVSFSDLRRSVIDKMMTADGWVTNDMEREIAGRPVFIVTAQTAASKDGRTPEQFWSFYFTEFEGRIYCLGVVAPRDSADRVNLEAEQVLSSLRTGDH